MLLGFFVVYPTPVPPENVISWKESTLRSPPAGGDKACYEDKEPPEGTPKSVFDPRDPPRDPDNEPLLPLFD